MYRAAWVVPISAPPIQNGAVGVDAAGRIAFVGAANHAPGAAVRDLGNAVLLPGLVNAHTHLELTAMRGFLEEMPFFDWISTLTRARREVLSDADLAHSARAGIEEGLTAGISTFADTSQSGVTLDAMLDLGVRGVMYLEVFGPDPAMCDQTVREFRDRLAHHRARETGLVRLGVSPHAPYSVSAELFTAIGELAVADDLPVAIHVAESADESRFVRDGEGPWADAHRKRGITVTARGVSPVAHLAGTGVLGARPLLIHCIQTDAADIGAIAAADCPVAHCPLSNAKLGHDIAPLTDFVDAGVRLGLGSDSVASNNRMDLLEEARAAVVAQRLRARRPDTLNAARALELATLGGARALGLDDRIGSLEVGKEADLAAFALDSPRALPVFDPVASLVWAMGGSPALLVTVRGREIVRDGIVLAETRMARDVVRDAAERLARWRAAQH